MAKNSKLSAGEVAARTQGLGSSDIPVIMGVNGYKTPWQLWREKKGLSEPMPGNIYTAAGNHLEDAVASYFEEETGRRIIKKTAINYKIQHPGLPFISVSPDREYYDVPNGSKMSRRRIMEAKTTQKEIDKDSVPLDWFAQLQFQLGVARKAKVPGMELGSLAWLQRGLLFDYMDFDFDGHFYDEVESIAVQWWNLHIVEGVEPALTTAGDVELKFPESVTGKEIQATDEIKNIYSELYAVKRQRKEYEVREEKLTEKIKLFMLDASAILDDAIPMFTWKTSKAGFDVDNKKLASEFPEVFEKVKFQKKAARPLLLKE